MNPLLSSLDSERGAVLVMVATFMALSVTLITFVIDVGHWFEHRRHLQLQADAAALAGGGMFGACFNSADGDSEIFREASRYAGSIGTWKGTPFAPSATAPTAPYNRQVSGSPSDNIKVLYQSQTYFRGGGPADDTKTDGPCAAFQFDVKATEIDLPWFLGGGLLVSAINAHARVELQPLHDASPSLPLAVPDINPKQVAVTFVNESATGAPELGTPAAGGGCSGLNIVPGTTCTFSMTKPTSGSSWSGPAAVALPTATPTAKIGIRVGVGGVVASCANRTAGTTYACYDGASSTAGVVMIRDYAPGAPAPPVSPANQSPPVLDGVWPTTCAGGTSFFFILGGTCAGRVTAEVNFGKGSSTPSASYHVRANVAGVGDVDLQPVSYDATRDAWFWATSATSPIPLPFGAGSEAITLSWEINDSTVVMPSPYGTCKAGGGNKCKDDFPGGPHQRFFSGLDDSTASGPIRSLTITGGPSEVSDAPPETSNPASVLGSNCPTTTPCAFTVTVGLAGSYRINKPCPPPPSGGAYTCFNYDAVRDVGPDRAVLLRLKRVSGANTYSIDCGGNLKDMIENGCIQRYSLNESGICPDPANPNPPDCADVKPGVTASVQSALNKRFSDLSGSCLPNNYPVVRPGDGRVVVVMLTDFSAFAAGTGSSFTVPVVNFGAFYVTGWSGASASCDNEPFAHTGYPEPKKNDGDIWGHFVTYVDITGGGSGTPGCDRSGLLPCVSVLTK